MACQHKHVTKTSGKGTEKEWMATCIDCGAPLGSNVGGYYVLEEHEPIKTDFGPNGPQPGTVAYTAFLMAQLMPPAENDLPDDYWDQWKEEN